MMGKHCRYWGIDSGLDLSDYDYDFLGDAKSNVDSITGGIRAWAEK